MKTCDDIQLALSILADDGGAVPADVTAHLAECTDCAHFAQTWLPPQSQEARLLAQKVTPAMPHDVLSKVMAEVVTAPKFEVVSGSLRPKPKAMNRALSWLPRIAAALALFGVAWWLLAPRSAPSSSQARQELIAQIISSDLGRLMKRPAEEEAKALAHDTSRAVKHAARETRKQLALLGL